MEAVRQVLGLVVLLQHLVTQRSRRMELISPGMGSSGVKYRYYITDDICSPENIPTVCSLMISPMSEDICQVATLRLSNVANRNFATEQQGLSRTHSYGKDVKQGSVRKQKSKLRLAHLGFNRKLNSKPDLFCSIFLFEHSFRCKNAILFFALFTRENAQNRPENQQN